MSVELLRRAEVVSLLESSGRHPRKSLGQHFVVDPGTIRRIVRLAGVTAGAHVLEVGPGLGSLTLGLLEAGAAVTAIEKDPELADLLRETTRERAPGCPLDVVVDDVLDVDLGAITASGGTWHLIANLPYNIATQTVIRTLDEAPSVETMLVMVQREVAERLVAGAGGPASGVPSVLVATVADAKVVGTIGPEVFYPRPRVVSSLVELRRLDRDPLEGVDSEVVRSLVKRSFGQRRKTLRRSLDLDDSVFEAAGVSAQARPQELSLDEWRRLGTAVQP